MFALSTALGASAIAGCESSNIGQQSFAIVEGDVVVADGAFARSDVASRDVSDWIQSRINEPSRRMIDPFLRGNDLRLRLAVDRAGGGVIGSAGSENMVFDQQPIANWRGVVPAAHVRLSCGSTSELDFPRDGAFASGVSVQMLDCTALVLRPNHERHRIGETFRVGFMLRKIDYLAPQRVGRDWQMADAPRRMLTNAAGLEGVLAYHRFDDSRQIGLRFARVANGVLLDTLGQSEGGSRVEL